jgi:GNAT superfamily N-acetyltransferase
MLLEQVSLQTLKVGNATIEYYLDSAKSHMEVISVRVPRKYRGQGLARTAMEQLIQMADDKGVSVSLIASPLDKKTHLGKLVRFYQSFGFEIGKPANAAGEPWMHRPAKS